VGSGRSPTPAGHSAAGRELIRKNRVSDPVSSAWSWMSSSNTVPHRGSCVTVPPCPRFRNNEAAVLEVEAPVVDTGGGGAGAAEEEEEEAAPGDLGGGPTKGGAFPGAEDEEEEDAAFPPGPFGPAGGASFGAGFSAEAFFGGAGLSGARRAPIGLAAPDFALPEALPQGREGDR
jgi:hypothetical protein